AHQGFGVGFGIDFRGFFGIFVLILVIAVSGLGLLLRVEILVVIVRIVGADARTATLRAHALFRRIESGGALRANRWTAVQIVELGPAVRAALLGAQISLAQTALHRLARGGHPMRGARLPPSDAPVKSFVPPRFLSFRTRVAAMRLKARFTGPITGSARPPGDKSISHRALIMGALAE